MEIKTLSQLVKHIKKDIPLDEGCKTYEEMFENCCGLTDYLNKEHIKLIEEFAATNINISEKNYNIITNPLYGYYNGYTMENIKRDIVIEAIENILTEYKDNTVNKVLKSRLESSK